MTKKRFVTRRFLYKGQTTGGWFIWDKKHYNWADYNERILHGGFEKRSEAFKKIEELEAIELAKML